MLKLLKRKKNKIEKLYFVCWHLDKFKYWKDVTVEWWKVDARWENVDYSQIIENYHLLNETEKSKAEEVVNELFTMNETELLRDFFRKRTGELLLSVTEVSIPIRYKDFDTGKVYDLHYELPRHEDIICLNCCFMDDYDLPFLVWGFCNLDKRCPLDKLPGKHANNGLEFLERAWPGNLPDVDCSQTFTSELVNDLYEQHGFYVDVNADKIHQEAA